MLNRAARRTLTGIAAALVAVALHIGSAVAGIQDWQVNEVLASAGGDTSIRYIELENKVGGCLFPTTQVVAYDAAGIATGSVALAVATTCFGPQTFFLLATTGAVMEFGTTADKQIVPPFAGDVGQICFVSSSTKYDCVRWGPVTEPIVDFFGVLDTTTTSAPPDAMALARTAQTHVVVDDWSISMPTPRGPNNGQPWFPPDAGPTPDAAPPVDAPVDAGPQPDAFLLTDAAPRADADPQKFLDVDPVGGASCTCRADARNGPDPTGIASVLFVAFVLSRRRRPSRGPAGPGNRHR